MNEKFSSQNWIFCEPVEGPVHEVGWEEVTNAVKKMKNGKAVVPHSNMEATGIYGHRLAD